MSCHLPTLRRLALASALAAALATGCTPIQLQDDALQTASDALNAAQEMSPGEETQRFLLRSAARFQDQGSHDDARNILRSDAFANPTDDLANQYLLLSMASAVTLKDQQWAQELVSKLDPAQFSEYPEDVRPRAARLQLSLYELAGAHLDNAQLLMGIDPALLGTDRQELNDRIWRALKKTSDDQLEEAATSAIGFENQGWYELAVTLRQPGLTFDEQGRAVRNWQFNWSGHPGTEALPGELTILTQVLEQRPDRITLALPLSGPLSAAGNIVREGFLAAYYADSEQNREDTSRIPARNDEARPTPNNGDGEARTENPGERNTDAPHEITLTIVDTHGRSIDELIPELMAGKPDLIVGPLAKEDVAILASKDSLPVPFLALNYAPEQGSPQPARLFQFGLSVEDEARQIAEKIQQEGLNSALVLIPRGDWGDRIARALKQRMDELGGVILNMDRYYEEDNLRNVTAELLGINISRERAIELERTIGINVEFEARRRQDVDAIIMVAEPIVARQFKPLFAYYYAGDVPVFSPSIIYSGRPNPTRDRDVNGVFVTDLPWILDREPEFRQKAYEQFDNLDGPLGRLFAMGADAWALSTRLPLMQQVSDTRLDGHTGELWLDRNNRVHRSQMWGVFREGVPVIAAEDGQAPEEIVEPMENDNVID
ncbi:penicillin-binding protein activator [Marinobacter bryozoorum]|uniref:penicillin-binding protein activator n=1 Tax=Marinobacter bryozoorum TaxID=256324 RepID=UPI002006308F|nr:penicillin-binding protein activator [Marinobacter bryozoorum]MCK7543859.1 penicillin-binding protein activator [Marinobacter bryozoorum]